MRILLSVCAVFCLVSSSASAQADRIAVGARVRVTSPADDLVRHVTTVTDVRGDSIVVAGEGGPRTIALRNATALDVSVGTRPRILRDAFIGFGAGALIGAALGAIAFEECRAEEYCIMPGSRGGDAALGALVFGAAGAVSGAIVGAFDRTDRWVPVNSTIRAEIRPAPRGGIAVSLSRAF